MQVHSIESLGALDGEGIRYTVFLSGCPLRCVYCHNPDTWGAAAGEPKSPEQLFNKIKRYVPYFRVSGGGVTFSGGEPLLQADKIVELAQLLKIEGIGYTLDTSGCVPLTPAVQQAVLGAELVICDLKFYTEDDYKKYTGGSLKTVTEFLNFLCENNKKVWVRTVIVPSLNDTQNDIDSYLKVVSPFLNCIKKYELLAFHTMGFFKYDNLKIPNPCQNTPALETEKLQKLKQYLDGQKEKYEVEKKA